MLEVCSPPQLQRASELLECLFRLNWERLTLQPENQRGTWQVLPTLNMSLAHFSTTT